MGTKFRSYNILGTCNPQLAHAALTSKPEIRLRLPCNVIIEAADENSCWVRLMHPAIKMQVGEIGDDAAAVSIANDAAVKHQKVVEVLRVL